MVKGHSGFEHCQSKSRKTMKLPINIVSELNRMTKTDKKAIDWKKYPDVDEMLNQYYNKIKQKPLLEYIKKLHPDMPITLRSMEHRWRTIS